jgi:hypothetical protein
VFGFDQRLWRFMERHLSLAATSGSVQLSQKPRRRVCQRCGGPFEARRAIRRNTLYCHACARLARREKSREWKRRFREEYGPRAYREVYGQSYDEETQREKWREQKRRQRARQRSQKPSEEPAERRVA